MCKSLQFFFPKLHGLCGKSGSFTSFVPKAGCRLLLASDAENDNRHVIGAATLQCRIH
jgi:hypothetical protein